ncbi:MAG TPA: IPT/TIG domain-containing protein [Kofleriaceae bacterium]|nr:IPT/TIG domain-containing protein [Kofleriaceae bacterium]
MRGLAIIALALAGCAGGGNLADGGAPADAGPTGDAFDLPDARNTQFGIQFIDPDHGPFTGGTRVLIRGVGFADGLDVRFGGRSVEPLDLNVVDQRRIEVRTPPGMPGLADLEVILGSDIATLPDAFTYEAITVAPESGSVAGGTYVTIDGLGTNWDATTEVRFDGALMLTQTVVNEQRITGFTPPGTAGTADVRVTTSGVSEQARRAYTYLATADPFAGGMGGGPIAGQLNIVVVDANTRNGVPNAFVAVGDVATTAFKGRTDMLGQITFSDPSLTGPVTVTAAATDYESALFVEFDARDLTIFLRTPPMPNTGPLPPGPQIGRIFGHVVFGDAVAIGSSTWDLVPEPRRPGEIKRAYVTTTAPGPFSTSFAPNGFIDFSYDPQVTAWEFDVWARPSALAVVAIAGLYDPSLDPSGQGVSGFQPFAMGMSRGILVGPGENVIGVDVVVNIPLDTSVEVGFDQPPLLGTPGWNGPTTYTIRPFLDFGGEGAVHMNKNGLPAPPAPELPPNIYDFPAGDTSILLSGLAPLVGDISDGSYGFIAGAYAPFGSNPYSVRIARGYTDVSSPLTIADFLPMQRPIDPAPGMVASRPHLELGLEGPSTGLATFSYHLLALPDGTQLWRIMGRGDVLDIELPDLTGEGFPPLPTLEDVQWTFWRVTLPGTSFDQFTYRHLSSNFWSAYAADAHLVQFPAP